MDDLVKVYPALACFAVKCVSPTRLAMLFELYPRGRRTTILGRAVVVILTLGALQGDSHPHSTYPSHGFPRVTP